MNLLSLPFAQSLIIIGPILDTFTLQQLYIVGHPSSVLLELPLMQLSLNTWKAAVHLTGLVVCVHMQAEYVETRYISVFEPIANRTLDIRVDQHSAVGC